MKRGRTSGRKMSANDAQLASLYRILLSQIYLRLLAEAPDSVEQPVPHQARLEPYAVVEPPAAYLHVEVDGRESSYFEWLGAGLYSLGALNGARNGRPHFLRELQYGFSEQYFYLRVEAFPEVHPGLRDCEFRVTVHGAGELRLAVAIEEGKAAGWLLESRDLCLLGPHELVKVGFDRILEVGISRQFFKLGEFGGRRAEPSFALDVELWEDGVCVDRLPAEGLLEIRLGVEGFAWPVS